MEKTNNLMEINASSIMHKTQSNNASKMKEDSIWTLKVNVLVIVPHNDTHIETTSQYWRQHGHIDDVSFIQCDIGELHFTTMTADQGSAYIDFSATVTIRAYSKSHIFITKLFFHDY